MCVHSSEFECCMQMMNCPEHATVLKRHIQHPAVRKQLEIVEVCDVRMERVLAGAMKHEAHLSDQQFKIVARYVNRALPPHEKYGAGGIIPHLDRVKDRLESSGLRLEYREITRTMLCPDTVIDLCDSSGDEEPNVPVSQNATGVKCIYVNNPMETLVKPELEDVLQHFPSCGELILHPRKSEWKQDVDTPIVDYVLHLDNTTLETATGTTESYETCVMRQILPGLATAQQSHFSCIPLFVFEGDEKYEYIHAMFARLIGENGGQGLLKNWVEVDTNTGQHERVRVRVVWHLCSDMKLIMIVLGLKAGGTYPCFMCQHTKNMGMAGPSPPRKPDPVMDAVVCSFRKVLDIDSEVLYSCAIRLHSAWTHACWHPS